jgi:DNA-binding transcriptional MerR regulator
MTGCLNWQQRVVRKASINSFTMVEKQIAFDFGDAPEAAPIVEKKPQMRKSKPLAPAEPTPVKVKSTRGRKSLKEMSEGVDLVDVPEDEVLYQKMYYSIGKVAEMFKVNQSLIRLWENEFDILKPKKNGKGDRLFRPEDIKNIQLIYHLTRERKYTMQGAKEFIKNSKTADEKFTVIESLKRLKGFLYELKANL